MTAAHDSASTTAAVHIGGSDLLIHPLGLGSNQFGGTIGTEDADLRADDDGVTVAAALHPLADDGLGLAAAVAGHPVRVHSPDNVARAAEESLERLRTDRIDLYWAHYDDEDTPLEDAVAAFDRLVRSGKVRHIGLSNFSPARIEEWFRFAEAGGHALPVALQPRYNLVARAEYEQGYAPLAERYGLGVLPYAALAGGFLTGKYRTPADTEGRTRAAAVEKFLTDDGLAVVSVLDDVAAAHGTTAGAVALAWQLTRPGIVAPLAGATRPEQVTDQLAAVSLRLTEDQLTALEQASRPFA